MSPEQARGETLDARTNIFSLGAVVYEMATGKVAFPGPTWAVIFKAILDHMPPSLSESNPQIPLPLDDIIAKALEKDRDLRCLSAANLRSDLKRLQRGTNSGRVSAATGPSMVTSTAGTRPRSRQFFWGIVAAVLAVMMVVAGGIYKYRLRSVLPAKGRTLLYVSEFPSRCTMATNTWLLEAFTCHPLGSSPSQFGDPVRLLLTPDCLRARCFRSVSNFRKVSTRSNFIRVLLRLGNLADAIGACFRPLHVTKPSGVLL